jgi:hypothetical protein
MYDILHRVGIKASPRQVYDALITPRGLAACGPRQRPATATSAAS